jgi:hypothetical protein
MDDLTTSANAPGSPAINRRSGENRPPPNAASRDSLATLWRAVNVGENEELNAKDAASTLFRFFRSKHVIDLKLIAYLAILLFAIYCITSFIIAFAFPTAASFLSPAIPITGGVLAWAYLSAATRLGVVDLFACEIGTVCRVGTIFEIGDNYVKRHENVIKQKPDAIPATKEIDATDPKVFIAQENYFPVFGSNSHDLEALEALVVGNITEFYTYMKVARDLQRKLAAADNASDTKSTLENLIYVLYLGYESGRKSILDLIEFEPTRAENIIVILITELICYSFLVDHFEKERKDDVRLKRLMLRRKQYLSDIPDLVWQVNSSHKSNKEDWERAQYTTPELARRYKDAFGEDMDAALARRKAELTASA